MTSYRIVNNGSVWEAYKNSQRVRTFPLGLWTPNDVQVASEILNYNDQVPGGSIIANKVSFKNVNANGSVLNGNLMRDDATIQGYYRVSTHEFQVWDKGCSS